jgi:hypothetical protein
VVRLVCTRCRADVKSVLRYRAYGALCPTSEIGAAIVLCFSFGGGRDILVFLTPAASRRRGPSRTSAPALS